MDSSLKLDSGQVRELIRIDSSLKYVIRIDSALLASDSVTRKAIIGGLLGNDSTVDALNDSTRKWLRRISDSLGVYNDSNRLYLGYIADSIGISVDSLITHIDSIKRSIPKDVFDSILKYQKQLAESEDSIIIDGLPSIDSLIDSSLKYWRMGLGYDSIYNGIFKDSIKTIHDAISDIGGNIGYGLGYGDTASTTLRGDLDGVKSAIASLDSSVSGGIGDIVGLLAGTSVDTASANYGRGFVASGQRMGDSVKSALGWGYVDTLNIDSLYARALSGYKSDSISQDVLDSLNQLGGRLNDSLVAKTDSIKAALPSVLDSMADSLVLWAPFADFDSIIYSSIGAHIPNRAECPENCQKWTVSIPIIGLHSYTVDFGLCLGRASFAGLSVLGFLKLLIRIIVAYTCIMTIGRVLVRMI